MRIGYGNYMFDVEFIKNVLKEYLGIRVVSVVGYVLIDWEIEFWVIFEGVMENESWIWDVYVVDCEFIELLEMIIIKGCLFFYN